MPEVSAVRVGTVGDEAPLQPPGTSLRLAKMGFDLSSLWGLETLSKTTVRWNMPMPVFKTLTPRTLKTNRPAKKRCCF